MTIRSAILTVCLGSLMTLGCATSVPTQSATPTDHEIQGASRLPPSAEDRASARIFPSTPVTTTVEPATAAPSPAVAQDDNRALDDLWKARAASSGDDHQADFTLGPGDILRISLPQIDEAKERTVRVTEEDTISLPLIGEINVSGMTEDDLRKELVHRLRKYFYHPQVALFLQHTENRQVAVLGAVKVPGRYMLASRDDTLMAMISRAGGTTEDAASRIILIPSARRAAADGRLTASAKPEQLSDASAGSQYGLANVSQSVPALAPSMSARANDGLVIDLSHSANERYLTLPAKSGDVIIVPAAGEVTVQGWVDKPGSFKITPGMTVLSAIAAAGGALFTSSVTLLREHGSGKLAMSLDLAQIKGGTAPDMAVQGGDVVIVNRSAAGAIPYSLYFLINRFGWGFFPPL